MRSFNTSDVILTMLGPLCDPIWTLTQSLIGTIEACETWFLRGMGKISWKQKMKNEVVLKN